MIYGLRMGFEPTINFTWTYWVTHLEWAENQALGLKLVLNPRDPLVGHSFTFERWLGF